MPAIALASCAGYLTNYQTPCVQGHVCECVQYTTVRTGAGSTAAITEESNQRLTRSRSVAGNPMLRVWRLNSWGRCTDTVPRRAKLRSKYSQWVYGHHNTSRSSPRPHRRRRAARLDLGERWPSRLVAAAEQRLILFPTPPRASPGRST
jgi:hypothetical protein